MNILKIRVQGQTAVWENPFEIVSGSQNYLYIKPIYGKDWDGLDIKFLFRDKSGNEVWNSEMNTNVSDGTDGLIRIPASIISDPFFIIGVLGYGAENKFVPTASLKIDVTDDGYDAFSKVNGVNDEEKERLAELVLSDFKAIMDSYAETMAEYAGTMAIYSAQEEDRCAFEGDRRDAETARINAESLRQKAESRRASAEGERVLAEEGRKASEESRKNAENERNAYEDTRAINERVRVAAENDRRDAENKRASAESERENGEDKRAGAEAERLSAEGERKGAEIARKTAEEARVSRENIRGENEASRELAEETRVQAENQRVLTENTRVTRWQEFASDIEDAVRNANGVVADCKEQCGKTIANCEEQCSETIADCESKCDEAVSECRGATEQAMNVTDIMANALKGNAYGEGVAISGVSPVEHIMDVNVRSKNIVSIADKTISGNNAYASNTVGSINLLPNTVYTLSVDFTQTGSNATVGIAVRDSSGTTIGRSDTTTDTNGRFSATFTSPEDGKIMIALFSNITATAITGTSCVYSNFQIEEGTVATPYTPYVEDVSGVSVNKYGANVLPYASMAATSGVTEANGIISVNNASGTAAKYCNTGFVTFPAGTYTFSIDTISVSGKYGLFIQKDVITDYSNPVPNITGAGMKTKTFTLEVATRVRLLFEINAGTTAQFKLQINVGDVALPFEEYKEPVTYTVNADGTVDGVTSLYPTTTLIVDTEGTIVDCGYNKDINKAFAELEEKLTNAILSLGGNV